VKGKAELDTLRGHVEHLDRAVVKLDRTLVDLRGRVKAVNLRVDVILAGQAAGRNAETEGVTS
jgi:hypothetical protein